MINKQEVLELLDGAGIDYKLYEHAPVYTVEEALQVDMPYNEYGLKNLFLKDNKRNYYIYSLYGNKKADLKALKAFLGVSNLRFASEEELKSVTGLEKGHVTPLGALGPEGDRVTLIFDDEIRDNIVGIHPMSNDATVFLGFDELYSFLSKRGVKIKMF